MGNAIVIAVLAAVVVLISRSLWKNRNKGGCSGNCSACKGCR